MSAFTWRRWPVLAKIGMVGLIGIVGLGLVGFWLQSEMYETRIDERVAKVGAVTESGFGVLDHFHQLELAGELTTEQAQARAVEATESMRYDDGNYMFIFTDQPRYVSLVTKPEWVGAPIEEINPKVHQLLTDLVATAKAANGGIGTFDYDWPKPGAEEDSPKTSTIIYYEPWNWVIGTGVYIDDIDVAQGQIRNIIFGVLAVVAALIGGATFVTARSISRRVVAAKEAAAGLAVGETDIELNAHPAGDEVDAMMRAVTDTTLYLRDAAETAEQVAAGDLTAEHTPYGDDDTLGAALVDMIGSLRNVIGAASQAALEMGDRTKELAETAQVSSDSAAEVAMAISTVADGASHEAEITGNLTIAVKQISEQVEEALAAVAEAAEVAATSAESSQDGQLRLGEAVDSMEQITRAFEDVTGRVSELGTHSAQIDEIVGMISEIAEQTNLLALNAAIEAARAGEQGRGFAVVATEVKALATQASQSSDQIAEIIGKMRSLVGTTVEATQVGTELVATGTETVTSVGHAFEELAKRISSIGDRFTSVQGAAQEIEVATHSISDAAVRLSGLTDANSATSEEVAAAGQEAAASSKQVDDTAQILSGVAAGLAEAIDHFDLRGSSYDSTS